MQVSARAVLFATAAATALFVAPRVDAREPVRPSCGAHVQLSDALLTSGVLTECFGWGNGRTCWTLDVPTHVWKSVGPNGIAAGNHTPPPPPPIANVTTGITATVCAPDHTGCHTVSTPMVAPPAGLAVVVSADRALVAAAQDTGGITIVDMRTNKLLATIAKWAPPGSGLGWSFGSVTFSGELLFVYLTDGVHTYGRVFEARTGKNLGDLAGGGALDPAAPIVVGKALAIATVDGSALELRDAATGKLVRDVPLLGAARASSTGLTVFAPTANHDAIFAVRVAGDGTVALFDAASGQASTILAGCRIE